MKSSYNPPLNSVIMATEIEGIKEVTEAILGIGEVAIDNFTFKVSHSSEVVTSYICIS